MVAIMVWLWHQTLAGPRLMELSQNPQPSRTRPPGMTAWHAPAVASRSAASGVPSSRGMAVSASTPVHGAR